MQPTAGYAGPVNVGGTVATPVAGTGTGTVGSNPVPELGRTETQAENAAVNAAADKPLPLTAEALESMTVAQLTAHAAERQIDLGGATRKADITAAIQAAGR